MRASWLLGLTLSCASVVTAGDPAPDQKLPPATNAQSPIRVWVDQIGYRPTSRKIITVASDATIPKDLEIEIRNAATGKSVWSSKDNADALKPFNGGQKDGDSGDFITQVDISKLQTPGRYYAFLTAQNVRSYQFNIADFVQRDAGLAAWKFFYFNRADTDKPEKYASLWNHGPAFLGPNQAKEAHIYKWVGARHFEPVGAEVADPTPYDVRGAWWDAGDFSKYTGNTVRCINDMLLTCQIIGGAAKDKDLNIPESGNGVPDLLDEIRWGTDYMIRLVDKNGATFGKVFEKGGCPPDAVKDPVQLTVPNSSATMARAAALAYAAVVWTEFKADDAYAKQCLDESMKSWTYLQQNPHPWPKDAKDPNKMAYTGEWFSLDYNQTRALAAACYFKLTGKAEYDAIVKEEIAKWGAWPIGELGEIWPVLWVYAHAKGADAATVEKGKKSLFAGADAVVNASGFARGYSAGVKGYWWGSNRHIGMVGAMALLASIMTDDAAAKQKYLDAAEEYIHYLYGRNPLGKCFLTNFRPLGAENSIMVMFHSWVGADGNAASAKYVGEGPGKIGPFPGAIVGGTNGSMKRYEEGLHWTKNPWEFNEPDITYQSGCCMLITYFGLKMK